MCRNEEPRMEFTTMLEVSDQVDYSEWQGLSSIQEDLLKRRAPQGSRAGFFDAPRPHSTSEPAVSAGHNGSRRNKRRQSAGRALFQDHSPPAEAGSKYR